LLNTRLEAGTVMVSLLGVAGGQLSSDQPDVLTSLRMHVAPGGRPACLGNMGTVVAVLTYRDRERRRELPTEKT
jgi:hypothetical protein